MDSTKQWYQSQGVWGSIITVIAVLLGSIAHFSGNPTINNAAQGVSENSDGIITNILMVVAGIGGLISLIGRIIASAKITPPKIGTNLLSILLPLALCFLPLSGCQSLSDAYNDPQTAAILAPVGGTGGLIIHDPNFDVQIRLTLDAAANAADASAAVADQVGQALADPNVWRGIGGTTVAAGAVTGQPYIVAAGGAITAFAGLIAGLFIRRKKSE